MSFFEKMKGAFGGNASVPINERIEPTFDAEIINGRGMGPEIPRRGVLTDSPRYITRIGSNVNFDRAMTLSAVFACIKILSESVASLPIEMYSKDKNGNRKQVHDHPLIKLLRNKPNAYQTRIEFFETLMLNLLAGNAYIKKGYWKKELVSLEVINSGPVKVELGNNGSMVFKYTDSQNKKQECTEKEIWHLKLFGTGLMGMSPLAYASSSIGVGLAADSKVGRLMENGAKPTGALMTPGKPTKEQREALRNELDGFVSGEDTFMPVLENNMKFERISLTPEDIQLIDERRFSVEEVCRFFGVPDILINAKGATTWGSGIEQIIEGFYKFGLRPYFERIEESIRLNLLDRSEWDDFEFEFKVTDLLRASFVTRIASNQTRIFGGQATINEVRFEEGKPPIPGGDNLLISANLITLDRAIQGKPTGEPNDEP